MSRRAVPFSAEQEVVCMHDYPGRPAMANKTAGIASSLSCCVQLASHWDRQEEYPVAGGVNPMLVSCGDKACRCRWSAASTWFFVPLEKCPRGSTAKTRKFRARTRDRSEPQNLGLSVSRILFNTNLACLVLEKPSSHSKGKQGRDHVSAMVLAGCTGTGSRVSCLTSRL